MSLFFAGSINQQLNAFLEGFYEIIPKHLISIFNEQELELLISGLPNVDIDDLYANTEYKTYTKSSSQVHHIFIRISKFLLVRDERDKQLDIGTKTVLLRTNEIKGYKRQLKPRKAERCICRELPKFFLRADSALLI